MTRRRMAMVAAVVLGAAVATQPAAAQVEEWDPWEKVNRGVFTLNQGIDDWVLAPAARGIDWAIPRPIRESVDNFFDNLRFPVTFVNSLLQGKPIGAIEDFVRFGVNTTFGIAGFFDPADAIGLLSNNEDLGQTFAVWKIPPGPYLMVPILGPMTVRDGVGLAGDVALGISTFYVDSLYTVAASSLDLVVQRTLYIEEIEAAQEASLDYYLFVRNAYYQRRDALIRDALKGTRSGRFEHFQKVDEDDLYFLNAEDYE